MAPKLIVAAAALGVALAKPAFAQSPQKLPKRERLVVVARAAAVAVLEPAKAAGP